LLAISKGAKKKVKEEGRSFTTFVQNYYDAKISDMGLGKQLIGQSSIGASFIGESSFRGNKSGANSIGIGPGTVGWQAPEVMAMRSTTDSSVARSIDSTNPTGESREFQTNDPPAGIRTSRSVDIFSLGCIFYSLLIPGFHPFGEWFEREANIMHNRPNLNPLKKISSEAYHLICSMLQRNPKLRPTAKEVCKHPFFWNSQKKLTFLCDFSDRLETDLITQASSNVFSSLAIERGAAEVVGTSWEAKLHSALIDNVQKFRTYDYSCVRDLLRLIRNKHHHFEELPEAFRLSTVPNQDALYEYFSSKFPALIIHCYSFCGQNLTEDDQMVSKFDISLAKFDIKEISTAPTSVTLKEKQVASDKEINSIDQSSSDVSPEEPKHDVVNGICPEVVTDDSDIKELDDDIIVWEGSIAAKTFNCRGWHRSQDEWSRHIEPFYKKRDPASKRCMEDPKFRSRLCNHWDTSFGTFCPMRKKNKCVFAHGPAELRVKEGKKNRWGKLVDKVNYLIVCLRVENEFFASCYYLHDYILLKELY
jgi:serine/threonine-protein kinase/endoribonuclease IRE1